MKFKSSIIILAFSVLGCSQMLYAAPTDSGRDILSTSTVTVGTVIGARSGRVKVPITFQGDGETQEFTADVTFPLGNISLVTTNPVVPSGGATCLRISDTRVRVSISAAKPLPSLTNVRYCDIRLDIGSTATGGSVPLTLSNAVCTDISGSSSCQTVSGAVNISGLQTSLADGTNIVIAGYEGTVQETRRLRITNLGVNPLPVACLLDPPVAGLSLTAPTSIPPGQNQDAVIACTLPALGTPDRLSFLRCTTNDPVRPLLRYSVTCTTVAAGQPLPTDQLLDNELEAGDQLGAAAAQSSVAGTSTQVLALGAPFAGAQNGGNVRIYEGDTQASQAAPEGALLSANSSMRPAAVLGNSELRAGDKFGSAVLISPDGRRIAIGAPKGGPNGNLPNGKGAVFVYDRPANGWSTFDSDSATLLFQINAPAPIGSLVPEEFGSALAFTSNGDLVVGAPATDAGGITDAGRVFRYRINGSTLDPGFDSLTSIAPVSGGRFGTALAMNSSLLVVGAPGEGVNPNSRSGSAYAFSYVANTFGAPTAIPNSLLQAGGNFGASVAINGDVIVIGCPGVNTTGLKSGAALVYRPSPGGAIIEQNVLLPNAGANQESGASVATNGDSIIVGAPDQLDGLGRSGSVYVYRVNAGISPPQSPTQKLIGIGTRPGDNYGKAVSMNGQRAVVGSPLHDVVLSNNTSVLDAGQGHPFILDAIHRDGFQ